MKYSLLLTLCMLFCIASYCQRADDVDVIAFKDFQKAEKELNYVYRKIFRIYHSDTIFLKQLKITQKIWLKLRDAELNAKLTENTRAGSAIMNTMCWNVYKAELTRERIKHLRIWLNGIEEGDVCTGSVRIRGHVLEDNSD